MVSVVGLAFKQSRPAPVPI